MRQCRDKPSVERLKAALLSAGSRLERVKSNGEQHDPAAAQTCLDNASKHLIDGCYYLAWDCLHQFESELLGLSASERSAAWLSLSAEAKEKLRGWRAEAAQQLCKKVEAGAPVPPEIARQLHAHLWAAAQNAYYKLEVYERSLPALAVVLSLVVLSVLAFCYIALGTDFLEAHDFLDSDSNPETIRRWARALLLGMTAGALSGILSMTFTIGRLDASKKIPEIRLGALMTYVRPLLGAVIAVPVVALVQFKYVQIIGLEPPLSVLPFCFVAGFSESWFLGLMGRLELEKGTLK